MNEDQFAKALKLYVSDSAVTSTINSLEQPPGKSPDGRSVELSRWYKGLQQHDRDFVRRVITEAAGAAVFGFCCVLDGVRVVEDRLNKGEFELYYVNKGERTRINDPQRQMLHDLFNWYSRDHEAEKS